MRTLEPFPNLVAMFRARAAAKGDVPFLWAKREGAWRATSWAAAARTVDSLAAALRALGIAPGDRVLLVSENRPEWCLADLAIMSAGAVTVPAYVTNTPADHLHVLTDSGASAAIVSTPKLARALAPAIAQAGRPVPVIGMEPLGTPAHDWAGLIAAHPDAAPLDAPFGRGDLACLIYTSGTGGTPRGVRQHHGAILHNCAGEVAIIAEDFGWTEDEIFLSFLPLSHAYEHSAGQFLPIALGAQIYYAEGLEKLAANMAEVRPTIMIVVPRLFEVLRTRIIRGVEKQGALSQRLLALARGIGAKRQAGRLGPLDWPAALIVDRMFKPRIAQRFGGRIKAMVSGGAPLNPEVGHFFQALGVTFLQGYGQTEAAPVISCNRPRAGIRMDSVGPPLPNTQVRIAADGEICVRGELVMHGYWNSPEETARALVDGWLHTGDIGEFDAAGRLRITDRKKDLIVNDKGENIAPQRVEGMLTLQPEIGQAMIAGDRRPYMVGVIVPDADWLRERRITDWHDPAVRAGVAAAVDRVNAGLSITERVRRFILADEGFTIENGQLTPSLKTRRHVLKGVYGERLDGLYRD